MKTKITVTETTTEAAEKLLILAQTLAEYVEPEIWADCGAQDAIDELDNYLSTKQHSRTKL